MTDIGSDSEHIDIDWVRVPVDKETLLELNRRRNGKAFVQSFGQLGLLMLTGGMAIYAVGRWPWWTVLLLVFIHGTFFHFLLNGFHELCHGTVFKTKWAGALVLRLYSLISQYHFIIFQESHRRHHRYTLHPPYDSEVLLPIRMKRSDVLKQIFIDLRGYKVFKEHGRLATNRIDNPWFSRLFPESKPKLRYRMIRWSRITLGFHTLIIILGIVLAVTLHPRWLLLPVLISFVPFYGRWLNFLLNDTQHVGLSDNVPDFRLCARSIRVNPFFAFLYWQMNYHIEHHMYAGVPFYNLPKLNRLIRDRLPEPPNGVIATWLHIRTVLKKQKEDPTFVYTPPLPEC